MSDTAIPPTVAPASPKPGDKSGDKTKKPPRYHALAELLTAAYTRPFRKLVVKKADVARMRSAKPLEPVDLEAFIGLAASDRTLERTRALLLTSLEMFAGSSLATQTRSVVRGALSRHPAFQLDSLALVLDGHPTVEQEAEAVRALSGRAPTLWTWPAGTLPLTKGEIAQCAANSMACLLLWLRDANGLPFARMHHYLNAHVWRPASTGMSSEIARIKGLLAAKDHAALAISYSVMEEDALDQRRLREVAQQREQAAHAHANDLQRRLDALQVVVADSQLETKRLLDDLQKEKALHDAERSHWNDDYQALRGRLVRRLKEELTLLEDGLHALQRNPPIVDVMLDHAERAIAGLREELKILKGNNE